MLLSGLRLVMIHLLRGTHDPVILIYFFLFGSFIKIAILRTLEKHANS